MCVFFDVYNLYFQIITSSDYYDFVTLGSRGENL